MMQCTEPLFLPVLKLFDHLHIVHLLVAASALERVAERLLLALQKGALQVLDRLRAELEVEGKTAAHNFHIVFLAQLGQQGIVHFVFLQVHKHKVCVHGRLQCNVMLKAEVCHAARPKMALSYARHVQVERHGRHKGIDTILPYTAAALFLEVVRLIDEALVAHKHRANGRAQRLGQADGHQVEALAVGAQRLAQRHRRVQKARAVQVEADAVRASKLADAADFGKRHHHAMQSVLQADDAGRGGVDVAVVGREVLDNVVKSQVVAVGRHNRVHHSLRQGGQAARLVQENVRPVVAENGVRRLHQVGTQRNLVGHGARNAKERRLFAGEVAQLLLEPQRFLVFFVDRVAHCERAGNKPLHHRVVHGFRGHRERVAAELVVGGEVFVFDRHSGSAG